MLKVLDLFSGTQSTKSSLEILGIPFEYKGFDIKYPEKNIIFDLSQDNIIEKITETLGDWKPDFIWASPLCTTFSRATCITGGTLSYELDEETKAVNIRQDFSYITHDNYVKFINDKDWQEEQKRKGVLGLKLMENTKKIIDHFNVPFAIENPAFALSRYVLTEYVRNICNYCRYGFDYKKTTAIYTSVPINLLKCNHKKHSATMSGRDYKKTKTRAITGNKNRSRVPESLIASIIVQLTMKGANECN